MSTYFQQDRPGESRKYHVVDITPLWITVGDIFLCDTTNIRNIWHTLRTTRRF